MHAHMKPAPKDKLLMPQRVFAAFLLLILGLLPLEGSARLLPALDTSSPYATMRSFDQEMQRIAALHQAYRAQPSAQAQRALGAAASRAANQLLDMSHVPPATLPEYHHACDPAVQSSPAPPSARLRAAAPAPGA
jgi:hypothetical protein